MSCSRSSSARKLIPLRWAFAVALALPGVASADEVFKPTSAITLPAGQHITSFDIGFVDPALGVYVLADRTNKSIDVVETEKNTVAVQLGKFVGFTGNNDTSGPNGVLIVDHQEVWAGDGNSKVKVIDLLTHKTTHVIDTGGIARADELCYDPREKMILIANDAEHANPNRWPFVTFISAETYQVVGKITMDGFGVTPRATNGIEQCQWLPQTGMFYVNIPEVNGLGDDSRPGAVLVIDPKTMKITNMFRLPLKDCAGPQGMALGPNGQILLGCNLRSSAIIDSSDGHVITGLRHETGSDQAAFNPRDNHYFIAERNNPKGPVLGVIDAGTPDPTVEDHSASTGAGSGAHSVAVDPTSNQVYVPISSAATGGICSSAGGVDAQGCIAVYTARHDRD